jgi:hypothetical protein
MTSDKKLTRHFKYDHPCAFDDPNFHSILIGDPSEAFPYYLFPSTPHEFPTTFQRWLPLPPAHGTHSPTKWSSLLSMKRRMAGDCYTRSRGVLLLGKSPIPKHHLSYFKIQMMTISFSLRVCYPLCLTGCAVRRHYDF